MEIKYHIDKIPTPEQVVDLYNSSGLPRPTGDRDRIAKMYANSNLIVTAWDNDLLVGAARSNTDWAWSCYLADLAIREGYKKAGIGKKLIELTKEKIGDGTMLLLLSVPSAMEYYPKVGFTKQESAFIINRTK